MEVSAMEVSTKAVQPPPPPSTDVQDNNELQPSDDAEAVDHPSKVIVKAKSREVAVRLDIQQYFEVVSCEERKLKCKLAGTDACIYDGEERSLKYDSRKGWFSFERHLARKHKIFVGAFKKQRDVSQVVRKKISRSTGKKLSAPSGTDDEDEFVFKTKPRKSNISWESLRREREKRCIICHDVCSPNNDGLEDFKEFFIGVGHEHDQFSNNFPGCRENSSLSRHLFVMFFLKEIIDFPMTLCEEFLKRCRGMISPDAWISFCSNCKKMVSDAVETREKIRELELSYRQIKKVINEKAQVSNAEHELSGDTSSIEEEIRKYIRFTGSLHSKFILPDVDVEAVDTASCSVDEDINGNSKKSKSDGGSLAKRYMKEKVKQEVLEAKSKPKLEMAREKRKRPASSRKRIRPKAGFYAKLQKCGIVEDDKGVPDETESSALVASKVPKIEPRSPAPPPLDNDDDDADFEFNAAADSPVHDSGGDSDFEPSISLDKRERSKETRSPKKRKPIRSDAESGDERTRTSAEQGEDEEHRPSSEAETGSEKIVTKKVRKWKDRRREYFCELCPSKYNYAKSFKYHVDAHRISKLRNNEFDCPHCGYPCLSLKAKRKHVGSKHREPSELACTLCSYVAPSRRTYFSHLSEHRAKSQEECIGDKFLCKLCNRLFISYALLCRHKRLKHHKEIGIKQLECDECKKIFSCHQHLRSHVLQVHCKESKYFCETCGRGFLWMSKLKRHLQAHADRIHVCDLCGADFLYLETLKSHFKKEHRGNSITGESKDSGGAPPPDTEYPCKHCGIKYPTLAVLHRHVKRDHVELYPHQCDICFRHYSTQQSLRRHKDINHAKHEVPCPYCGKIFSHMEYVKAHYKFCKKHPDKYNESQLLAGEVLDDDVVDNLLSTQEVAPGSEESNKTDVGSESVPNAKVEPGSSNSQSSAITLTEVNSGPSAEETEFRIESVTSVPAQVATTEFTVIFAHRSSAQ